MMMPCIRGGGDIHRVVVCAGCAMGVATLPRDHWAGFKVRDPTTWTTARRDGPNHLGL